MTGEDYYDMSTVDDGDFESMGSTAGEDVQNKQHFAYKEALERHITEMEIRASEAVKERSSSHSLSAIFSRSSWIR